MDYYIKTNQPFHVSDTNRLTRERSWIYYTGRIGDYTRKMFHTAYFFDQHDVTRWFPKCFRWNFCPGDVYFTPDTPTVVKSRLLTGDNSNSVILKLDKLRHFMFVHDTIPFRQKKTWQSFGENPPKPGTYKILGDVLPPSDVRLRRGRTE